MSEVITGVAFKRPVHGLALKTYFSGDGDIPTDYLSSVVEFLHDYTKDTIFANSIFIDTKVSSCTESSMTFAVKMEVFKNSPLLFDIENKKIWDKITAQCNGFVTARKVINPEEIN